MASYIYPSSYNGAWVLRDKELETTTDPALLDTIYRSRMMGLFGFGTLHGTLPERISLFPPAALEAARRNVPFYKRYRHLIGGDAYHLFPPAGSAEGWQAIQFSGAGAREAVILCFRNGSRQALMRLPVKGLLPGVVYKITSANGAAFSSASGADCYAAVWWSGSTVRKCPMCFCSAPDRQSVRHWRLVLTPRLRVRAAQK